MKWKIKQNEEKIKFLEKEVEAENETSKRKKELLFEKQKLQKKNQLFQREMECLLIKECVLVKKQTEKVKKMNLNEIISYSNEEKVELENEISRELFMLNKDFHKYNQCDYNEISYPRVIDKSNNQYVIYEYNDEYYDNQFENLEF